MTSAIASALPALGALLPDTGDTYAGAVRGRDGQPDYHLVAALGDRELVDVEWGAYGTRIEGADSYHDGRANTEAMLAADLPLAKAIRALGEGWYLPSQAEVHLLAANLKELLKADWYWTSTQYSALSAWCQSFGNGHQTIIVKDDELRAVAVRRLIL